jgi:cell division protein FtsQ
MSEVDVSNPEDVKALVASGSTDILVHFGDENFLERYKLFEQNLPQWKAQYPKLASVDTRYEHQMVLEMAAGTAVPVSGPSDAPAAMPEAAVPSISAPTVAAPVKAEATPAKPAVVKAVAKPVAKSAAAKSDAAKKKLAMMLAAARKTPNKPVAAGAQ